MCLFVVLLAVFTWAVHRRLAQYDSVLQDGHHLTATKVCLPDRPQVTVLPEQSLHGSAVLVASSFVFTFVDTPAAPMTRRELRDFPHRSTHWLDCGLSRFLFLPPPTQLSSL